MAHDRGDLLAQHRKNTPTDTLEQLESLSDRLVRWISANPLLILGTAAAILLAAASIGGLRAWRSSAADAAAEQVARVRSEYVVAMGGSGLDTTVPEPANPETARQIRADYVERFVKVVDEHSGTPAQALAALEASRIFEELGATDRAREIVEQAISDLPTASPVRAVALRRVAVLREAEGDFEAAARAHAAAAEAPGYPLRFDALADAARCWAEAGNAAEAVAVFARLQGEAPEFRLPPYLESRLTELQAVN
jgi:tetratricopeptide (TPR) repeat protein